MALLARVFKSEAPPPPRLLSAALCAAELGEPFDFARVPGDEFREFFAAVPSLRVSVPFATLRLLSRLCNDPRVDVRVATARALQAFVDCYPRRVEELLLLIGCDSSRKVRAAAAETMAKLLPTVEDPWQLIEAWQEHPDRARDVLKEARKQLPAPLGFAKNAA
jgi:hypothetical protein